MYNRKDTFYTRAKVAGYRSRAAFKLEELVKKFRLLRPGDRVIDLGAWPGGWLQVALQHVGPRGRVVAVDVQNLDTLPAPNAVVVVGDVRDPQVQDRLLAACQEAADVVLSDLAPKLTGVRARDEAQAQELVDCVLGFAQRALKPGGHLIVKLFMSPAMPAQLAQLRTLFAQVRTTRPEATRKASAEIYAVATEFRGTRPA